MSAEQIEKIVKPEGVLAQQLEAKRLEYQMRWQKAVHSERRRYQAPELKKATSEAWYSWFILNSLMEAGEVNVMELYQTMTKETNGGLNDHIFWAYIQIINSYATEGHGGERTGNKPLPKVLEES